MKSRGGAACLGFALLLVLSSNTARAQTDEPKADKLAEKPVEKNGETTPSTEPKKKPSWKDFFEEDTKPFTSGWHAGSPPGERIIIRLDYWKPDLEGGTEMEFGKSRPRVGVIRSNDLGYSSRQPVWGGGALLYTGKMGWLSVDYWQLEMTGSEIFLDHPRTVNHTDFPLGDLVRSEILQHFVRLRDGYDVRYRVPLADEVSFDFVFEAVLGMAIRQESLDVRSVVSARRGGGQFTSIGLFPGIQLGAELHLPLWVTLSVGSDIDWLPQLPNSPFSVTDPKLVQWSDARIFFAARFLFVEASVGYRYFKTLSEGPTVREAEAKMSGFDFTLAARF